MHARSHDGVEDDERARVAGDLQAEVARGRALDRALARDLGRPEPRRAAPALPWLEALGAGATAPVRDERALLQAARAGDPAARARLVEAYMPLISAAARPYRVGHVQRAELLQEGVVGLLRALERFDVAQETPFWAYATWWVRQAMQQLVSELTRPVVLSDRALRRLARLKDAHRDALRDGAPAPGSAELAARVGLPLDQVEDLLATDRAPRSLDEPVAARDGGGEVGTFGDLVADPLAEDAYERVLAEIAGEQLHALLAGLSPRERDVLRARYGLDGDEQTLREVGGRLGLSGERVRQIERRALGKLAAAVGAGAGPPDR